MSSCPIHSEFNTPPTLNDDACNSNGTGFFVKGSTWLYVDPVEPICKRLFIQQSEICNMADWLEISVKPVTNIRLTTAILTKQLTRLANDNLFFEVVERDDLNEYSVGSGNFTVKCSGTYMVTGALFLTDTSHTPPVAPGTIDAFLWQFRIFKNGSFLATVGSDEYIINVDNPPSGFSPQNNGTWVGDLVQGDIISFIGYHELLAVETLLVFPGVPTNFIAINRVA